MSDEVEVLTDSQQLALDTLRLHMKLVEIQDQLEKKKELLRRIANDEVLRIEVGDAGSIYVTAPRPKTVKKFLAINEDKLNKVPELRTMLITKGVLLEESKVVPGAKASVKISPRMIFASPVD